MTPVENAFFEQLDDNTYRPTKWTAARGARPHNMGARRRRFEDVRSRA